MNGYTQETEIDNMCRIVKILAPNEQATGALYTIRVEYRTPFAANSANSFTP
jgi:hypothetical protein